MIRNRLKRKSAVTLVELLVAVLLLGMVVLTGVSVELAMRRMQTKPTAQVKLLDELIPVVAMIKKDFERQIGNLNNVSVYVSGSRVEIRVDDGNLIGQLDPADPWHAYNWSQVGGPIMFSNDNFSVHSEIIAQGITYFNIDSLSENTGLKIEIKTRKDPNSPEDLFDNPSVNLTTTVFSRMTSAN